MFDLYKAIEIAKANGWTCEQLQHKPMTEWFIVNNPKPLFTGMGESEIEAWSDLFCDPELEHALVKLMPYLSAALTDENARPDTAAYGDSLNAENALESGGSQNDTA